MKPINRARGVARRCLGAWIAVAGLVFGLSAEAIGQTTHYVWSGAPAGGNGSSWSSAWRTLPSSLVRGHTYYIADGNYPSYTFNTPTNGSQFIYIKKATVADHGTDAGWSNSMGDGTAVFTGTSGDPWGAPWRVHTGYLDINGQVGSGKDVLYGFKITSTQCSGLMKGVLLENNPDTINIRHVEMEGCGDVNAGQDAIYGNTRVRNLTIADCYMHRWARTIFLMRTWRNVMVERCYIKDMGNSHGIHAEGVSDTGSNNVTFRYNTWENVDGVGFILIGEESDGVGVENYYIYGNLFFYRESPPPMTRRLAVGNGTIAAWGQEKVTNVHVYNNTIVNVRGVSGNAGINLRSENNGRGNRIFNNLFYNVKDPEGRGAARIQGAEHGYNAFFDSGDFGYPNQQIGTGDPLVDWRNGNFHLKQATLPGALQIEPFNVDMLGNIRGADGVADRGALEFLSIPDLEDPTPPTNLHVTATEPFSVSLAWTAGTDNIGVSGYRVFRDGEEVGATAQTAFTNNGLTPETTYTYTVQTVDLAGNRSGFSNSVNATTDPPPTPNMTIDDINVVEGHAGTTTANFTVSLDSYSGSDIAVDYQTQDGTATSESGDYIPVSGTLLIPAGQLSGAIPVSVRGDLIDESNEEFTVALSNPSGNVNLVDSTGRATILDDDGGGPVPGDGLILFLPMSEGSGSVAADASGFEHDGALSGNPTWNASDPAGGLSFDGSNDRVFVGTSPLLDELSNEMTVSLWLSVAQSGRVEYILDKGGLATGFYLRTFGDGALLFKIDDGSDDFYAQTDDTTPTDGQLHHVAAVLRNRDALDFYIDGIAQSSSFNGPLSTTGDIGNSSPLVIGMSSSLSQPFEGFIDDVRIYNRALTFDEVAALHAGGRLGQQPSLASAGRTWIHYR
jgi:chitodextrinase